MSEANNTAGQLILPNFKDYQKMHKNTLASLANSQMGLLNLYQGLEVDLAKIMGATYETQQKLAAAVTSYINNFVAQKNEFYRAVSNLNNKNLEPKLGLEDLISLVKSNVAKEVEEEDWKKKFEDLNIEYGKVKIDSDLLKSVRGELEESKSRLDEATSNSEGFESLVNKKNIEITRLADKIRELESEISIMAKSKGASGSDRKKEEEIKTGSVIGHQVWKLDPNTPVFSAKKGENIKSWISNIEDNLVLQKIPPEHAMKALNQYIKGTAKIYHEQYKEDGKSWDEFKECLLRLFKPDNQIDKAKQRLIKLRQGDSKDSYEEYMRSFSYWASQLRHTDMDDTNKLFFFKQGLKPQLFRHLNINKPDSLEEAMEVGLRFEENRGGINDEVRVNNVGITRKNYKKPFQLSQGNQSNSNSNSNNKKKELKCYNCLKIGHISTECRSKAKTQGDNNKYTQNKGNKMCHICKKPGHFAKFCRSAIKNTPNTPSTVANVVSVNVLFLQDDTAEESRSKILSVKARMDHLEVTCGLDTGAERSVMNYQFAVDKDITIVPTDIRVRGANNTISNAKGKTLPMNIQIENSVTTIEFILLNYSEHDVLLGVDWFDQSRALVDYHNRRIHLPTESTLTIDHPEETSILLTELSDSPDVSMENDWPLDASKIIKMEPVSDKLTKAELGKFEVLIEDNNDMFANSLKDLGECGLMEHSILTVDEEPLFQLPYRKSERERLEIKKEIDEMIKYKIIRESRSPWSSPVILIPKPNGTKRMCIDYRRLNKKTIQQNWPIPRILDILDRISRSIYFTAMDLKSGYWQIKLNKNSIAKTAFSTQDGHYEFLRLPFGLKNAPADFSRIMHMVFPKERHFVEIYLDDMIVHSKTFEEHLGHINTVFKLLREAGLKLNPEKCTWCANEIKILGHIVSFQEIKMDVTKVMAVKNWGVPRNVKQVQEFLGFANYYRRFIKDFSNMAKPLYDLLKKDSQFIWTTECNDALETLKRKLCESPVLRAVDPDKEIRLHTDASNYAVGGNLSQLDDDGSEYSCGQYSRLLKGAELNYTITEKECLAVILSVKNWIIYLYGKKFTIITDHIALKWLMNLKDPTGRLARWAIYLEVFDLEIIHRAGRIHSNVDGLSRPILPINLIALTGSENEDSIEKTLDVFEDEPLLYFIKNGRNITGRSTKTAIRITKQAPFYKWDGDKIWHRKSEGEGWKEVPPLSERREIIIKAHLLGHFKDVTTYNRLKETYWWKKMLDQIKHIISQCGSCERNSRAKVYNHPAIAIKVNGLFDTLHLDLVLGLEVTKDGYNGIFTLMEAFASYPGAYPIKTKTKFEIGSLLRNWICLFGPPKVILSDQGSEFINDIIDGMCNNIGIPHKITSAYNPRTNGKVERFNQTLIGALRKQVEDNHENWADCLDFVLFAYRTRINTRTGFTPYELVFGMKCNNFENWTTKNPENELAELNQRANEIKNKFEVVHEVAKVNMEKQQEKQKEIQNSASNVTNEVLELGQKVFIKNDDRIIRKLEPKFRGPYTVIGITDKKNYYLEDVVGTKLSNALPLHKLKKTNMEEEGKFYEVEKILEHKKDKGQDFYLVKWKNFSEQNNSWEPANNFANKKIINDFLKSKGPTTRQNKRRIAKVNYILSILTALIFLPQITIEQTISSTLSKSDRLTRDYEYNNTINELKYCSVTRATYPIDLDNICDTRTQLDKLPLLNNWIARNSKDIEYEQVGDYVKLFTGTVLTKAFHKVHGRAWYCKMEHRKRTWRTSFWGEEYFTDVVTTVNLDAADCEVMKITKFCGYKPIGKIMSCMEETCEYKTHPEPNYSYFSNPTQEYYFCWLGPKTISSQSEDDFVFNHVCRAKDLKCRLDDSMIIWKQEIIHECPFYNVTYTTFNISVALLTDDVNKIALQVKGTEKVCGTELLTTTEGIYLDFTKGNLLKFKLEKFNKDGDIKGLEDLNLADTDYKYVQNLHENQKTEQQACNNFVTQLKIFRNNNNKFMKTKYHNGDELVVYAKNNQVYKATCSAVSRIFIPKTIEECRADIRIRFQIRTQIRLGYLTTDKIIIQDSDVQECPANIKYIHLERVIIAAQNQNQEILELDKVSFDHIYYFDQKKKIDLTHMASLVDTFDLVGQVQELQQANEKDENFNGFSKDIQTGQVALNALGTGLNFIRDYFSKIGYWILGIVITLIIIFLITLYCCYGRQIANACKRCCKTTNANNLTQTTQEEQGLIINEIPLADLGRRHSTPKNLDNQQQINETKLGNNNLTAQQTQNKGKEKLVGRIFPRITNLFDNVSLRSKKNSTRSLITKSQIIRLEPTAPSIDHNKKTFDQNMFKNEDPYLIPNTDMDCSSNKEEIYTTVEDLQKQIESDMKSKCEQVINEFKTRIINNPLTSDKLN